jgi:hypothetical protein
VGRLRRLPARARVAATSPSCSRAAAAGCMAAFQQLQKRPMARRALEALHAINAARRREGAAANFYAALPTAVCPEATLRPARYGAVQFRESLRRTLRSATTRASDSWVC